jgi:hypothetical protein
MTPMTHPEYMRMKIKDLPEEFVRMYNLTNKAGYAQQGRMATLKYNTHQVFGSISLSPSDSICALMTLASNISAMKISNTSLRHYALSHMRLLRIGLVIYCGINLEWNYIKRWMDVAMPACAIKNLP